MKPLSVDIWAFLSSLFDRDFQEADNVFPLKFHSWSGELRLGVHGELPIRPEHNLEMNRRDNF